MKIKIFRASDFTRKVEYDPIEIEKLDLLDIATRFGHADSGELITVVNADNDELLGRVGWDSQYREYVVAKDRF
jgi:hypothetical protein